jgi:hypothetical protein
MLIPEEYLRKDQGAPIESNAPLVNKKAVFQASARLGK